jgi:predicted transcriptional regulator
MVKRSMLEICFDVLKVIQEGITKPTQIMYETNISWITLQNVFDTLINSAFVIVKTKGKSKRYGITAKGGKALSFHEKFLQEFGITPLML